jgi:chitodextrinase
MAFILCAVFPPGTISEAVISNAPPGAPTGVALASLANTSAALSWVAPSNPGSAPISYYSVEASKATPLLYAAVLNTTTLSGTVKNLLPATAYVFQVRAVSSIGASPPSSLALAVTTLSSAAGSSAAAAPVLQVAPNVTSTSISIAWTPPNLQGVPLLAYQLQCTPAAVVNWTLVYSGVVPSFTLTGTSSVSFLQFFISSFLQFATFSFRHFFNFLLWPRDSLFHLIHHPHCHAS